MQLSQYPLLRLILPVIAGITIAIQIDSNIHIPISVLFSLLAFISILTFYHKKIISYGFRWLFGVLINIALILFGFELTLLNTDKFKTDFFGNYLQDEQYVIAKLVSPVEIKSKSVKAIVEIETIKSNKWIPATGKALIYLQKDSLSSNLEFGDELFLKANFREISSPQNPHEFDYKKYLANRKIYHQAFLKTGNWKFLKHNSGNIFMIYAAYLQKKITGIFVQTDMSKDEYSIASALIVGYKDFIDRETIQAYSNAGVIHILCVAGLHVGIVYLFFNYLIFFLDKYKHGKIIKAVLQILFIWFYALITGMSPSVLRAVTMISFIIIGKSLNRQINTYNMLAASAFLLIIINPYIITESGFQLSYLAVTGIVMLYKKIYHLWSPENYLLNKIWALTSVSIAAQVMTFPLALYYFHQFPNYFILTNLFAIPLATLGLYAGILLVITFPIHLLAKIFSFILLYSIRFLNISIKFFSNLPYSTFHNISVSLTETILIYSVIIFIIVFFSLNKKKYLYFSLISSILLAFSLVVKEYQNFNQQKMIIYYVNKCSAYDFINGKTSLLLADSIILSDKNIQDNSFTPNRIYRGINSFKNISLASRNFNYPNLYKKNNFIQFLNRCIVVIDKSNTYQSYDNKIKIDYLIIRQNPQIQIEQLISQYQPKKIIFDSSNPLWKIKKWKEECIRLKIQYHSVPEQGAFEI